MIPSKISGKTVRGIAKYVFVQCGCSEVVIEEEMECGECGSCFCLDTLESMDGDFDDYAFYDVTLEKNPRVNEYLSQLESDDDDC